MTYRWFTSKKAELTPLPIKIQGWMYRDELQWILQRALEIPDGGMALEIGSFQGKSTARWCQGVAEREEGRAVLFCVDPWAVGYRESSEASWEKFKTNMFQCGYAPTSLRMTSIQAALRFPDGFFDLVFIDGDHDDLATDLRVWIPKMKPGGLLCGHDYREGSKVEEDLFEVFPGVGKGPGSLWYRVMPA